MKFVPLATPHLQLWRPARPTFQQGRLLLRLLLMRGVRLCLLTLLLLLLVLLLLVLLLLR